jgi:long-chain fatty acid transport protein
MNPGRKEEDMKKCCFAGWIAVLSVFLLPLVAFAGGFGLNEQGAKATGMANAFAAQADDPTAVYFNPAGIVQLEGTQVTVGVSPVIPGATFESNTNDPVIRNTTVGQKTHLNDDAVFVPNAYLTQKISDRVSFGFGTFSNFGLETNWPNDWEGRFIEGGTKAELTTFSVNPVLAFKPHERVSLAVGPVMQYLDFDLRRKAYAGAFGEPNVKFTGDDVDWGWNAALMVWLPANFKFGASYRSEVSHRVNGRLKFSPNIALINLVDTGITSNITTPANAYLGLAWTHGPLTLEFDAQWTDWSSWSELAVNYKNPVGPTLDTGKVVQEDWHDAWGYRFGAQFAVTQYLDVRAGFAYDESPIPTRSVSPRIPGGDRWIYALGLGGHFKGFTADIAYQYVNAESVKMGSVGGDDGLGAPLQGKFKNVDANIIAFNLSYQF